MRRVGTPITAITFTDERLDRQSGAILYCFNWDGEFLWEYPKGVNTKVHGYVKFVKNNEGWKPDHMNYTAGTRSLDTKLKCP